MAALAWLLIPLWPRSAPACGAVGPPDPARPRGDGAELAGYARFRDGDGEARPGPTPDAVRP